MTYAAFRWGTKTHHVRPAANEKAARWAWDWLSRRDGIVTMKLVDGLWMCKRPNGDLDDISADAVLWQVRNKIKNVI